MKWSLCSDYLQLTFTTADSQKLCSCGSGTPPVGTHCLFSAWVCYKPTDFTAWKHLDGHWLWELVANETGQGSRLQLLDCSQSWTQTELGTSTALACQLHNTPSQLIPDVASYQNTGSRVKVELENETKLMWFESFTFIKSWRERSKRRNKGLPFYSRVQVTVIVTCNTT